MQLEFSFTHFVLCHIYQFISQEKEYYTKQNENIIIISCFVLCSFCFSEIEYSNWKQEKGYEIEYTYFHIP